MVEQVTPIAGLDIIGYNDVLTDDALPMVVAPVFTVRDDPERILFPPFRLTADLVVGGTWDAASRWRQFVSTKRMSALDEVRAAQQDHELWIDLDWGVHYDPHDQSRRTLGNIADHHCALARQALVMGDESAALEHASIAYNADSRLLDPLIIKAAIYQSRGDEDCVELLAHLATGHCTREFFDSAVANYMTRHNVA